MILSSAGFIFIGIFIFSEEVYFIKGRSSRISFIIKFNKLVVIFIYFKGFRIFIYSKEITFIIRFNSSYECFHQIKE